MSQKIEGAIHSPGFESPNSAIGQYSFYMVAWDSVVCLQVVFTDFLLEASLKDQSAGTCGPKSTHLKVLFFIIGHLRGQNVANSS